MIYGIGTDLVELKRISKIYSKYKSEFISKILSEKEVEVLSTLSKPNQISYAGKLFCIKEAFSKALKTGIRGDICFKEIELTHDKLGAPYINLYGRTKKYFDKNVKGKIHVSLSDEKENIVSFVVIER
jgi:holo-[acyl-carrier protein] synthase